MNDLVDIGTLRTVFTADLSDLQAKSKQAQEIAAQTAAAMTAAFASAGNINTASGSTASFTQGTQAMVSALNQVTPAAAQAGASLQDLALKKANLVGQIKSVDTELRAETKILSELQQASTQFGSGQKAVADALQQSQTKVAGLIASQTQLQGSLTQVNAALKQTQTAAAGAATGIAQITPAAAAATTSTTNLRTAMQAASQGMLVGGTALVALGAGFAALVKSGSDLQQELVHVAGNTSMSAAEFENLQRSVIRMGLTAPAAMGDIGRAYMQAANFGFHFAEANTVVEAALKSAVATGADAEQTTRALAVAMHLFNIPAAEAAQTMDVLHLAAARGGQTLEQFTAVTGRVFSVAHAMGVSLVDVSAAMSALTSAGLPAAQAATLLQGAIVKIANPAKQAEDEIKKLSKATGVDLVHDFSQAGLATKGLQGVLDDISKAVGSNTSEIFKLVPAMRGGIGVIILTTVAAKDYKDRLQELNDVMAGKLKPTQQDFERVMKTVGAQAGILGNTIQALGLVLVQALGPSLVTGLETLNGALPKVVLFIGQLPPVIVAATGAFIVAAGAVGTISVALGALVFLLSGPVAIAILALGVAVGTMAAVVALNFGRVTDIFSTGSKGISINFIELAGKAGAVLDAFQVLARGAIAVFDVIVTGATLMAQAVKLAFQTVGAAARIAVAFAKNDMAGVILAVTDLSTGAAASMGKSLLGLGERLTGDLKDISAHATGQFAKSFALAASEAGQSFKRASAEQHQLLEEAGLKLVNAYVVGAMKAKPMTTAMWHSMSDEARASFTKTAQAWVQANANILDDPSIDEKKKKAQKMGKALVDGFKEGVSGLSAAFDVVAASLESGTFSRIFDVLPKNLRAAAEKIKQAATEVVKELDDLLKHVTVGGALKFTLDDKTLKSTIASLEQFGAEGVRQFQRVSEAAKVVDEEMAKVRLSLISLKQPVFEIPFTALYNDMGKLTESGKKMSDAIRNARGVIQVTFTDVSKVVSGESIRQIEAMDASANSVEEWSNQWTKSLGAVKVIVPSFTPALDALRMAVKNLKEDIASDPLFNTLKMKQETAQAFDEIIKLTEADGRLLGLTQDAINQNILKNMHDFGARNAGEWSAAGALATAAFKREMDKLPGALDEVFNKLALGAKHQVSGIFDVINNIPGKFGDSLRKTTDVITKWINQIDGILKGLHKIFDSIPDGLAGALKQFIGLFKANQQDVTATVAQTQDDIQKLAKTASQDTVAWSEDLGTQLGKTANSVSASAAKIVGGFGMIAAGALAFVGAAGGGGGVKGALSGAFSGALGALSAAGGIATLLGVALSPLTLGLSALGGAIVGGLIGLFSGGKSAAQKAQEAQQLEQTKISIQQSAQSVINAAIQGFDAALAFFERLDEFTLPRKQKFQQFFKAFSRLMDYFLELSKAWAVTSLTQAKAAAEAITPIAQAISALPSAFDAINGHFGIAQSSIDRFFADFDKVMNAFFARADIWIEGTSKRAMKVANRLIPVVDLISGFAGSLTAITNIKEPADEMFAIFDRVLEKIVSHVEALSGKFDKSVLKAMANFADRAGAALSLWTTAVEAIKATVDIPQVTDADAENVTAGIELFISKLGASLERLNTTDLSRITAFAQTIIPIANALKAWADTSAAVRGYTLIAAESWEAISTDFGKAIQLMSVLIGQATQFEAMAITLETILKSGAQHLTDGVSAMTSAVLGTASALQTAFGHIQGGVEGNVSAASFAPFSAPILGGTAATGSSGTSTSVVINVHQDAPPPGALTDENQYRQWMRNWWRERAARARALGEPPMPQYLWE